MQSMQKILPASAETLTSAMFRVIALKTNHFKITNTFLKNQDNKEKLHFFP